MLKQFRRVAVVAMIACASPAVANNPLDSGPLADFLNIFRQAAMPRQTVVQAVQPAPIVDQRDQRDHRDQGPNR